MAVAITNEERFIASCEKVGEADVRQRLAAGRYSERRVLWAKDWLDQVDGGKSEATRAEERSSIIRKAAGRNSSLRTAVAALLLLLVLASLAAFIAFN